MIDRLILLRNCRQTLAVIHNSTLFTFVQDVPGPQELNCKEEIAKAVCAKTTEAEFCEAMRTFDVGAAFSVVCEQGITLRTGPEIGTSLCRTVGITDLFVGEQSSSESTVWLWAGAVCWSLVWPLPLTIPAEAEHTTFSFGTQWAQNTLPFRIWDKFLTATWTLGARDEGHISQSETNH